MSFFQFNNISIKGIGTCNPKNIEYIYDILEKNESEIFTKNTGIVQRHIADKETCASDLCYKAAEDIIEKLNWKKEEIDILIFVTQTPDYILPASSNILQNRLGLSKNCYCLDISLGCSGYIYGMSLICSLLQNPAFNKGLLLVGDTITKLTSIQDKSVYPLFGDAGTATALEFDANVNNAISFVTGTDGSGEDAIKITHGGARNRYDESCLFYQNFDANSLNKRKNIDLYLDGVNVFNFAIKTVPKTINELLENLKLNIEDIDCFVFHQANLFMNETIKKRLKISSEKLIYSIRDYGNTNGASIPLTICASYKDDLKTKNIVLCGFGVGLSWGAIHYVNNSIIKTSISTY